MKNKTLQTLLQHNRRTLLLLLTFITTSQVVWGWAVPGSFNSWSQEERNASYKIPLSAGSYQFKIFDRNTSTWYGKSNWTMNRNGNRTDVDFENGGDNVNLTTDVAGDYTFTISSNNGKPRVTVTFPAASPDTYDVAGNGTSSNGWCCGVSWSAGGCAMTGNSSSYPVYKTFSNVPVSSDLQFKVTKNDSWDNALGWSSYSSSKSTLVNASAYDAGGNDHNIKLVTTAPLNITVFYDGTNVFVETEVVCTPPSSVTIGSVATQELKCCVAEPKNGNGSGVSVTATTSPSGSGNQYQWSSNPSGTASFASGSTSNPTVTFTREGNYTLTVGTGCGNYNTTDTENVTVIPPSTIYVAGPLFCTASGGCDAWCQNTNTMTRTDNGNGTYTYTSVLTALYNYNHASNKYFTVRTSNDASKSAYIISKNFTSASYAGITTSGTGNYDLSSTVAFSAKDRVRLTVVYNSSTANYSMTLEKVCSAGNNDITFSTGDNIMCVGDNPTANAPSDAIVPASATVSWVSHSPLVLSVNSTTGEVNALTSGSADIVYRITDNAVVCAEKTISTAVRPVPSQPTISGETVVCSGTEDLSYNITSGTAGAVYTWSIDNNTWTRTSASATTTPAIFTAGTGDATITATPTLTTSGKTCTGTAGTIDVDVNTTPSISVSSPAGTIYDYVPVTLSSASVSDWSYTGTNITGYFSSEAANGAVFKGRYTGGGSSGTATISAEGTNGCTGTLNITINKDSESCSN